MVLSITERKLIFFSGSTVNAEEGESPGNPWFPDWAANNLSGKQGMNLGCPLKSMEFFLKNFY